MKKSLFLLPLLASFALAGCEFTIGGKTITLGGNKTQQGGNNTGNGGNGGGNTGGGGGTEECIVIDITEVSTAKGDYGIQTITVGDYEYYDRQTYYSDSKGALWFFNKWDENMDSNGKATDSTVWAFIANKTAYPRGIKKVTFTTNSGTGGCKVFATFGNSAFNDAQTTGSSVVVSSSQSKDFTLQGDGSSKYFALSTYGDVGYGVKNLMLDSLTIWFE